MNSKKVSNQPKSQILFHKKSPLQEIFKKKDIDSVKVDKKMAVFGFEILGLKPRIFSGFEPK